ncbi:malonyl-[acyl-carrier protein] O-methyltransferase [Holospora elegans E1]|uniref:Malonyl-[acyl-carrier protein] O-methyltransferase n=1 Tax=Holospora elegans E1 TaxID=1427503 RepID=A0A023DYV1_9PROT|nr:methyltransferase domain-containing protein [Holospora elegans]GAJ46185.1 malonyl-[acyl-carrier protein] O-methyltransferase [Holospora elegans E1]
MEIRVSNIQKNFNKASVSYDCVGKIQKSSAKFLVDEILNFKNFDPKTILDVGTGTGYLPEFLLPKFGSSSFYLNDIADKMLEVCKIKFSKYSNVFYLPGDMLDLNACICDYVVSNLALQWVDDLRNALEFLNTKSSNLFAFSTLLEGNFYEWRDIINKYQTIHLHKYPKEGDLVNVCFGIKKRNQIFQFWSKNFSLTLDSALEFVRYLKLLGACASLDSIHLTNFRKLIQEHQHPLTVTYKVFFGIFRNTDQ